MNTGTNDGRKEAGSARFRPTPDALYERVGDQIVLIHMRTNQIYELNRTAARFWELLCTGCDRAKIQQLMLQEFDITSTNLSREIEALLASLSNEGFITRADT